MSGSHFSDHVASTGYPLTHLALPDAIDFTIWEVSEFAVKRGGNSQRKPSPTSYLGSPANEGARGCVGLQRDAGCLAATWRDNGSSPVQIEIRGGVMAMGERLLRRRQVEEVTGMSRSSIYRLMQTGEFPRSVKVGPTAVRWRARDSASGWSPCLWQDTGSARPIPIDYGVGRRVPKIGISRSGFPRVSGSGSPPRAASGPGDAQTGRTWRRPAPSSCPRCGRGPTPRRPRGCPSPPESSS